MRRWQKSIALLFALVAGIAASTLLGGEPERAAGFKPCHPRRGCSTVETTTTVATATVTTTAGAVLFEDTFDAPAGTPPDSAKWWMKDYCARLTARNDWAGCYEASNAFHDGAGHLVLRVTKTTRTDRPYDWAQIQTFPDPGAGPTLWAGAAPIRVEARVKMAPGAGLWEGPWTLTPPDYLERLEADTGEWRGAFPTVHECSVHDPAVGDVAMHQTTPWDLSADFHTYWTEYTGSQVTQGVDDLVCGQLAVPNRTLGLIVQNIVGPYAGLDPDGPSGPTLPLTSDSWGGAGGPPPDSMLPADLLVDYVRVTRLP